MRVRSFALAAALGVLFASPTPAATVTVEAGASIQAAVGDPNLAFNSDRSPRFVDARRGDFRLRAKSPAIGGGNSDPAFANADGSRNTVGHTGGPLADPLAARCRQ